MGGHHRRGRGRRRTALSLLITALSALVLVVSGCATSSDDNDTESSVQPTPVRLDERPTDLQWTSFNGMSIPAAGQGPHTPDPDAPHGFDRSPAGAALASINATIRMSVATDDQWPQIVRTLLAPGPQRDAFITSRIQLSTITSSTGLVPAGQAPQVLGWQVTAFTPQQAGVDIYTRLPDQSLAVNHTTVVWTGFGDWGLLLPAADATVSPVQTITTVPAGAVRIEGA